MKININKLIGNLIKIAKKSNLKYKHSAILINEQGKIISKAHNSKILFSNKNTNDKFSFHAEELCLLKAFKKYHKKLFKMKLIMVVIRINKNGEIKNSKPCEKCMDFMKKFGVNICIYSVDNNKFKILIL